jgi:SpoIVB peptidase S55
MLVSCGGYINLAMRRLLLRFTFICATCLCCAAFGPLAAPQQSADILPVDQVHAGMQGYAYTIFTGDQVEKFDLEVLGVMPNFLGPKQSIILVELKGPKVEHTGVVAGMSGSPVYLEGKLAGALSLKLGIFTKEAIAGVTPIEDVMRPPLPGTALQAGPPRYDLPKDAVAQNTLPNGSALEPIETPLVFSGFQSSTLQQFASQLQSYGLVATQGGTLPNQKDDAHAHLTPGDMAGMVLIRGDMSVSAACTVTAVTTDRVFLCGHPFLNLGDIQMPMARSVVVTTLSSSLASTKIVNTGAAIGTIISDHLTAVTGKLGPPPPMIPMDLTFLTGSTEKSLHFEMVNHPKLTPILMAITTFNGIVQNSLYGEGTTLHLTGEIQLKGHVPVKLENTFAPQDSLLPDGMPVAISVQSVFGRLFTNNFEVPDVEHVSLKVESLPGRNSYTIDSAWLETGEASPGENLKVRVLLRPYRGEPRVEETTVQVPDQIARGTTLRVLVTDADWMNRASHGFNFGAMPGTASGPAGLDQLISLINRERHNDRLYVGLFVPAPMMVWDDKEMPNVPLSAISVIDGRPAPGSVQVLRESLASESSVGLGGPVSGLVSLNLQIR